MRVIVDEGIGDTSPLWQQFQAWLGERSAEIVWLAIRYPAIPDVEILDKLLTPDTVLLTRDGVLHNHALAQGVRSFTKKRREAPSFTAGMDRRWACWARCPSGQSNQGAS